MKSLKVLTATLILAVFTAPAFAGTTMGHVPSIKHSKQVICALTPLKGYNYRRSHETKTWDFKTFTSKVK